MPQIGQSPGPGWRTSGCIGHVKIAADDGAGATTGGGAGTTAAAAFAAARSRYITGSAMNFSRHFGLQNQYS